MLTRVPNTEYLLASKINPQNPFPCLSGRCSSVLGNDEWYGEQLGKGREGVFMFWFNRGSEKTSLKGHSDSIEALTWGLGRVG